jgi:hypothetical protein
MDSAATLQATRLADLADILEDCPSWLIVGAARIKVNANQISLTPYAGERGLVEDGVISVVGSIDELRVAGPVKTGDQVGVVRYGEQNPRTYTVNDINMDTVLFFFTLTPLTTKRNLGTML